MLQPILGFAAARPTLITALIRSRGDTVCARYSLTSPSEAVRDLFGCPVEDFPPRYNIAPTQPVLIARCSARGKHELQLVRWGLIPPWAKDPGKFATLINARSETACAKASFRGAMRHHRCLVPASGFYEWSGGRKARQPYFIRPQGRELFAFAGIFEVWLGADGSEIETMAILTTSANADMAHIHDRMPVIIAESDFARWLDCRSGTADDILDLLRPAPEGSVEVIAVSAKVNNPRTDGPELHEPQTALLL
jgi:putative SOS response-associated peptidase YedK